MAKKENHQYHKIVCVWEGVQISSRITSNFKANFIEELLKSLHFQVRISLKTQNSSKDSRKMQILSKDCKKLQISLNDQGKNANFVDKTQIPLKNGKKKKKIDFIRGLWGKLCKFCQKFTGKM